MTKQERIATAKTYVKGGILGAIVTIVVGFGAGWVVTSGSAEEAAQTAKINAYATVCAGRAITQWTTSGGVVGDLDGWDKRKDREALAERSLPKAEAATALKSEILDRCEDQIEEAA